MKLSIQARFKAASGMSRDEILNIISPEIMAKIKSQDEHPFFQAFVTAHEGEGNPEILGAENKKISFPRKAIETIKNVVKGVIQAFRGHESGTNSTDGRKSLGQIVGQAEKDIDGKLAHISIFYHPPGVKEEAKKYDSCSHEGEWLFKEDSQGGLIAQSLETLQAVGLLIRDDTPPALPGSLKLGMVQAQKVPGEGGAGEQPPGEGTGEENMDLSKLGFTELQAAFKEEITRRNIHPHQLYKIDDLTEDKEFGVIFKDLESSKAKEADFLKQIEALTGEKAGLMAEKQKTEFSPKFAETLKEKKLTDETKAFINRSFKKTEFSDFSEEFIDKFITDQAAEYAEIIKISSNTPAGGETPPINQPIPLGSGAGGSNPDYTDKEQNPLFKED